jgi:hypothetical protein
MFETLKVHPAMAPCGRLWSVRFGLFTVLEMQRTNSMQCTLPTTSNWHQMGEQW